MISDPACCPTTTSETASHPHITTRDCLADRYRVSKLMKDAMNETAWDRLENEGLLNAGIYLLFATPSE